MWKIKKQNIVSSEKIANIQVISITYFYGEVKGKVKTLHEALQKHGKRQVCKAFQAF